MSKRGYLFFFVLVFLVSCSSQNPEPALTFEFPEAELPLAEPGPYEFSMIQEIMLNDDTRDGREISISLLYPSVKDDPDLRGAPFPLIINDHKMFSKFGEHLVSHGYIIAGINDIDTYDPWDASLYNQPLDYVYVLNQLADNPPKLLKGMIDTDHVGVWGYSFGGRNAVFLSGGRIDPEYYFENCENPEKATVDYTQTRVEMMCGAYENWDTFARQAGSEIFSSEDGLWQPITDERIIATIPMSSSGEWLFGPKGFASVDKAVLLTAGTLESNYYPEVYRIYEELETSEKFFISFVNKTHMMIRESDATERMEHLAIAFFSYHLKGDEAYAEYFSEEFISQVGGLAWGWYEE
jgi:predicted dienelactone hydrolase